MSGRERRLRARIFAAMGVTAVATLLAVVLVKLLT